MQHSQNEIKLKDTAGFIGKLIIRTYKNGVLIRESPVMYNKIVSSIGGYGRNLVIRRLSGDTTYGIQVDSAAIGTGNTAPTDADTGLQTPVLSGISITNATVSNDSVQFDIFASDGVLANGTYKEFGLFIGGRLFSRILISPNYTKATGEDSTFSYTITLAG